MLVLHCFRSSHPIEICKTTGSPFFQRFRSVINSYERLALWWMVEHPSTRVFHKLSLRSKEAVPDVSELTYLAGKLCPSPPPVRSVSTHVWVSCFILQMWRFPSLCLQQPILSIHVEIESRTRNWQNRDTPTKKHTPVGIHLSWEHQPCFTVQQR